MRPSMLLTLVPFILASLVAGKPDNLLERQDSCASVTNACPSNGKAYRYCSDYLDIRPIRTTTRITVSTVTITTDKTATTVTTDLCPTHGAQDNKKRGINNMLEERNPEPTSFVNDPSPSLEERQAAPPACLSKYTASSQLSSACSCYNYPVTSSTRTVSRTTTLPGAPTKTRYTRTVTFTTIEPTPTCDVVATNSKGNKTNWTEVYGVCNAFRSGGNYPEDDGYVYPADTPLCEALNRCANDVMGEGAGTEFPVRTFELSFNTFSNRPGGPKWDCAGYGANATDVVFYTANNWFETYGYVMN